MKKVILTVAEYKILQKIYATVGFCSSDICQKIETLAGKNGTELTEEDLTFEIKDEEKEDFLADIAEAKEQEEFKDDIAVAFIEKLEKELTEVAEQTPATDEVAEQTPATDEVAEQTPATDETAEQTPAAEEPEKTETPE